MTKRTDVGIVESSVPAENFGGDGGEQERHVGVIGAGNAGAGKEA